MYFIFSLSISDFSNKAIPRTYQSPLVQIDCVNTEFVKFMETSFRCRQQIKQSTTDSGSILDLIFSNCEEFCDVVEAYWTDHELVYCAVDQLVFRCRKLSQSPKSQHW